jgi:hypothetical protein
MKDNKRNKEVIRFLKWIRRYNGWWYLICNPGDKHMNPDMMKLLITKLAKESFYEIIFVLLMVHRKEEYVKCALNLLLLDLMKDDWKNEENIIKRLVCYFE